MPFSVKDLVITKGVRTTFGTPLYRDNVPDRGRADGRAPEGGRRHHARQDQHADLRLDRRHPQPALRDHPQSRGTSTAPRAARAAAPPRRPRPASARSHVGTDGGGSIRIPASCAGIFGLKPSFGRVPIYPASGAWSLSHVGPMTRTVADAALMLQVCAGPDERDQYSLPADGVDYVKCARAAA